MTWLSFVRRLIGMEPVAGKPKPPPSLVDELCRVAIAEVGQREHTRNQSPRISEYWKATSYPLGHANREPWCAAFLCWVFRRATLTAFPNGPDFKLPTSAAVREWPAWQKANQHAWSRVAGPVQRGDIVCWDFNGERTGGTHIGLAVSDESGGQFESCEGNTNAAGSREGDGVHRKLRTRLNSVAILRYRME